MSLFSSSLSERSGAGAFFTWGMFWLIVATLGAALFFSDGLDALLIAWQLPEYSHGPLIPVLSALLFLRELKQYPPEPGPKSDRWPGVIMVAAALLLGLLAILTHIPDFAAYGLIVWIGGIMLISFGWDTGKHFWPPVLHLIYMLPLPGVLYYKISTHLQFISSELGVWFLKLLSIPVFLDGNIIDLGVTKLHVAEACSGLRYMFPIMSFSYIFAVLYQGPKWHKAVLLISAVPIAIFMNSVRIALAGIIVERYGVEWVEGFSHFFEGWVIFLACVLILFGLAWLMLLLHPDRPGLAEALDLNTSDLLPQLGRLQYVRPSPALIAAAAIVFATFATVQALPDRGGILPPRESFSSFPRHLGAWQQIGPRRFLDPRVEKGLGADDYHQIDLARPGVDYPVGLFMAWYADQIDGGIHPPEICLPGSGWEIAWLERNDIADAVNSDRPFNINRAIIQNGTTRMMVYYWFQLGSHRIAWDFAAKYWLMVNSIRTGRTDGALVRLTTQIGPNESDAAAEARLMEVVEAIKDPLPRFIPLQ